MLTVEYAWHSPMFGVRPNMARSQLYQNPYAWAAVTAGTAIIVYVLVLPRPCSAVEHCADTHKAMPNKLNAFASCGLVTLFVHELVSLILTYQGAKPVFGLIHGIRKSFLPQLLICITFAVLLVQNAIFASGTPPWYAHAAAPGVRPESDLPVYTITYVEWLINVPLLLTLAGKCALGRSMEEIAGPIVVTNVYIILSWAAFFVSQVQLRWALVVISFVMYGWASYDMLIWIRKFLRVMPTDLPGRTVRPFLTIGLIITFGIYGIVYLRAICGHITPYEERLFFTFMDFISKFIMSMAIGGIRSGEYHERLIEMLVNTMLPFKRQVAMADPSLTQPLLRH